MRGNKVEEDDSRGGDDYDVEEQDLAVHRLFLEKRHIRVLVHVCRAKVRRSSRCKSCPGKGRRGRVAIPAIVEVTKRLKPGRQKAAKGRLQDGRP